MEQQELVVRAGRGDHDAFAVLARGALARLDAVARLILRDSELARDAVQEALVRAWRDLPSTRWASATNHHCGCSQRPFVVRPVHR